MIETQILANVRWLVRKARHPLTFRLRPILFFFYNPEDIITDPKEIERAIRLDDVLGFKQADDPVITAASPDRKPSKPSENAPTEAQKGTL